MHLFFKVKEEKGFTLVELLIVIAILAVLAVLAVPRFINMQADAAAKACLSNRASLSTAIEQYNYYVSQDTTSGSTLQAIDKSNPLNATDLKTALTGTPSYTPTGAAAATTFGPIMKTYPLCGSRGLYSVDSSSGNISCSTHGI